ncbi:MAG: tetratricopeptide repeat protein [Candidatus Undinarchaeales archaeon]|jgi:tetratricopeptide (TPR) repeat protein|nr:tetratricopeptide repeat protein [Candidatus Undinarchaeales archaeon]MDP7492235.1 tetratricopeptide repeat protein [Candidatus Undinarchaeales archaeon]
MTDWETEIASWRKAAQAAPNDPHIIYNLGWALVNAHEGALLNYELDDASRAAVDEAERMLKRALKIDPTHIRATILLGQLYRHVKRYTKAITFARRGMSQSPKTQDWFNAAETVASSYMLLDHIEGAIPVLEGMMEHYPEHPMVLLKLGSCYWHLGRIHDAERVFATLVRCDPESEEGHTFLGQVRDQIEQERLAAERTAVHQEDPRAEDIEDWDAEVARWTKKSEEEPENSDIHYNLGWALVHAHPEKVRGTDEGPGAKAVVKRAELALLRALMLDPDNLRASVLLGQLYRHIQRYEESIRFTTPALALPPEERDWYAAAETVASSYMLLDQVPEALSVLEQMKEHHARDPIVAFKLASCYWMLDHLEEAEREFALVVELEPGNEQARTFLQHVRDQRSAVSEPPPAPLTPQDA